MKSVSHIILATLLSTGTALAQETVDFDRYDTDSDGYLTDAEWSAVDYVVVDFHTIDTNRDGRLDKNEVQSGTQQSQSMDSQQASSSGSSQSGMQSSSDQQASSQQSDMQQSGVQSGMQQSNTQTGSQQQSTQRASTGQSADQPATMQQTSGQQMGSQSGGQQSFQNADKDRDNRVSRTEAQETGYDLVIVSFDTMDMNRDGYLDETEWDQNVVGPRDEDVRIDMSADTAATFDPAAYDGNDGAQLFEDDFDSYDMNGDGYLDEEEATADWVDVNLFEQSDINDDGLIDIGEAEDGFMEWGDEEEGVIDEDY